MASRQSAPSSDEVRRILVAAADVIFSDGVPDAFLDQWTEETVFLLTPDGTPARRSARRLTGA